MTWQPKTNNSTPVSEPPAEPVIRQPNARHRAIMASTEGDRKRFESKINKTPTCWVWKGSVNKKGYGQFGLASFTFMAHRFAYFERNPNADHLLLVCHHCDNPPCVNPDHLFLGTHQDNNNDAKNKGRLRAQKLTHCPSGHEYTPENTRFHHGIWRSCIICYRAQCRKHTAKRRAHLKFLRSLTEHKGESGSPAGP